ncbi:MAG: hypothetical protein KGS10_03685 [Chloroflexi bacterium]|nr:hypothetical protein [Chloroflexota bacterium]
MRRQPAVRDGRKLALESRCRYGQMLAETLPVLALDGKRPDDLDGEVSG